MKKFIPLILVWLVTLIFTGCYTHIAVDDSYAYSDPATIIIIEPAPPPLVIIHPIIGGPHPHPPTNPVEPPYKIRKPIKRLPGENIRNPGKKRDPVTPPKRDDFRNPGKIREPVTPPPSNDRIKDDSRNPGGRNDGGRKNRR